MTILPAFFFLSFSVNLFLEFEWVFKAYTLRPLLRNKSLGFFTNRTPLVKNSRDLRRPKAFLIDPKTRGPSLLRGAQDK
jgi:hypothetical protein